MLGARFGEQLCLRRKRGNEVSAALAAPELQVARGEVVRVTKVEDGMWNKIARHASLSRFD